MKQMNKEELIEFFIEQLGDNKILGKIMSIEQIREKLNYIIKDVKYDDSTISFANASWYPEPDGKGVLNFDLKRIKTPEDYKRIIVHEILHALSTKVILVNEGADRGREFKEINVKTGLKTAKNVRYYSDGTKNKYENQNYAIDEGMTDTLAEMITGIQSNSYPTEKDIYKIVSIIIGEDTMLKKYFSEDVSAEKSPLDIFKEDLVEKHGEYVGNSINEELKKVLKLSDQLLNVDINIHTVGITRINQTLQEKIKNEIYGALENIISELIEYGEPDIIEKTDDILMLLSSLNGNVSKKILKVFFENYMMSTKEKQSMADTILKKYFESNIGKKKDWNLICDLYLETGNMTEQIWYKKRILREVLEQDKPETIEDMTDKISQIKYKKVGDYYMVLCDDKYSFGEKKSILDEAIFDKDGKELQNSILWSSSFNLPPNLIEFYNKSFGERYNISITNLLIEKLREKGEDLKNKALLDKPDEENKNYMDISFVGNLFKIQYVPNLDNKYCEFYSVNSEGVLEQVEPRRRKKIHRRYVRTRYRITKTNCKCISK